MIVTVQAKVLPTRWQVEYVAGGHVGVADTSKRGVGGQAGPRPHELVEAALASCMTITARMWLDERGLDDTGVRVEVELVREDDTSRFRYTLMLPHALEEHRGAVLDRLACSPVRSTLSKRLVFEPVVV